MLLYAAVVMVPGAGIEPARSVRAILSLLCLPISPSGLSRTLRTAAVSLVAAILIVASPTGFEPVAYSLEGCCSIHLS